MKKWKPSDCPQAKQRKCDFLSTFWKKKLVVAKHFKQIKWKPAKHFLDRSKYSKMENGIDQVVMK